MDGLAFDPVHRRIYYTDTGPEVICSMDVNGDEHRVLVNQGLEQPRCIVVEPISRFDTLNSRLFDVIIWL